MAHGGDTLPDLTEQIEDAANEPASAAGDGQSAASHPLPDLIETDKYLAAKEATTGSRGAWGRVRKQRAIPPGAGPD